MIVIGKTLWAIAEGYIPSESTSEERALSPTRSACLLNAGDRDADVRITLFFADRDAVGPYRVRVPARRTLHLRFNDLDDPAPVPRDTDYASVIEFGDAAFRPAYAPRLAPCRARAPDHIAFAGNETDGAPVWSGNRPVAVVTGASAGVAARDRWALAQRGFDVWLMARSDDQLASAARDVEAAGASALVLTADVADPTAVLAAADEVARRWGRIDVWVNAAMATVFGALDRV